MKTPRIATVTAAEYEAAQQIAGLEPYRFFRLPDGTPCAIRPPLCPRYVKYGVSKPSPRKRNTQLRHLWLQINGRGVSIRQEHIVEMMQTGEAYKDYRARKEREAQELRRRELARRWREQHPELSPAEALADEQLEAEVKAREERLRAKRRAAQEAKRLAAQQEALARRLLREQAAELALARKRKHICANCRHWGGRYGGTRWCGGSRGGMLHKTGAAHECDCGRWVDLLQRGYDMYHMDLTHAGT